MPVQNTNAFAMVLLAGGILCGCQQTATAPEARHVAQSDLDFITGLTNLREFDHRVAGEQLRRASDPTVHALAADLLAHVDAFYAQVEPVAARDGIMPPRDMNLFEQSDMHARIASLMATSKYDFDAAFISDEIAGNQEILRRANAAIREPSGDPALRALLADAVTRLRDNLARLESVQARLSR